MELFEAIKTRRTVRKYKAKPVPHDVLTKILDAGRWAPSAHNMQPWKFVVVSEKDKIGKLADILAAKTDELAVGFNIVMKDTAKNLRDSPLLLAVYSDKSITKKFGRLGSPYDEIGNMYEIQSVATATENILLAAHNQGLGAAWYGMVVFCEKEINLLLKQQGRLLTCISIGYPGEAPKETKRKEISEIVEYAEEKT